MPVNSPYIQKLDVVVYGMLPEACVLLAFVDVTIVANKVLPHYSTAFCSESFIVQGCRQWPIANTQR